MYTTLYMYFIYDGGAIAQDIVVTHKFDLFRLPCVHVLVDGGH